MNPDTETTARHLARLIQKAETLAAAPRGGPTEKKRALFALGVLFDRATRGPLATDAPPLDAYAWDPHAAKPIPNDPHIDLPGLEEAFWAALHQGLQRNGLRKPWRLPFA